MLERFTTSIIKNIKILHRKYPKLVISQALYRQKNCEEIIRSFSKNEVQFLQVESSDEMIINRLISRGRLYQPEYAKKMRVFLEPMENTTVINNDINGEEAIFKQVLSSAMLLTKPQVA